jgi:hypothetical protein
MKAFSCLLVPALLPCFLTYSSSKCLLSQQLRATPERYHLSKFLACRATISLVFELLTALLLQHLTTTPEYHHPKRLLSPLFSTTWESLPLKITFACPAKPHHNSRAISPQACFQSCISSLLTPVESHRKACNAL